MKEGKIVSSLVHLILIYKSLEQQIHALVLYKIIQTSLNYLYYVQLLRHTS